MKIFKTVFILVLFLFGVDTLAQDPHADSGLKKVIVQEVIQVSSYTYLHVLEGEEKKWIAVPKVEAKLGEIYYYKGGMAMPNFHSTELNRTFDSVLFLGAITSADAIDIDNGLIDPNAPKGDGSPAKKPTLNKLELNIEPVEGGIRIATLFENAQQYAGKQVKIVGEVTKFTASIMGKNWVHFQDGTSHEGAYDLMITTQENLTVGDVVVFEGVIAINKDFGAGYFYKVIMEDAVLLK
ncbi:GW dipeptide domain-containing protein [Aestuariivivens marinum]|uniref:GW dipeptide domain-containing protein n=1 Tax=Aestuariivivens marinum TaxID=2913555 RepID=UPI001F5ACADC|nr:hypothetical protein [Aestuariivivens marinum]